MEIVLSNNYCELTLEEILDVNGGGTGLAVVCGVLTGVSTVAVAVVTPGGFLVKAKVAGRVLAEGVFLTATVYGL